MDEEDKRHEVSSIEQVPGLYMSDWVGASSVNENNILGITHILSVMTGTELESYGPDENPEVVLRHVDIRDEPTADMLQHLIRECDWLDEVLLKYRTKDGERAAVIVHCQQGISRSAAIIVAYLIRKLNLSYDEALKMVKQSREVVHINEGFEQQLRKWEGQLRGNSEVKSPLSPKTPIKEVDLVGIIDWRNEENA